MLGTENLRELEFEHTHQEFEHTHQTLERIHQELDHIPCLAIWIALPPPPPACAAPLCQRVTARRERERARATVRARAASPAAGGARRVLPSFFDRAPA